MAVVMSPKIPLLPLLVPLIKRADWTIKNGKIMLWGGGGRSDEYLKEEWDS